MKLFTQDFDPTTEPRCAVTPDTARKLIALGLDVSLAADTGHASMHPDRQFTDAGASIAPDASAALAAADIVAAVDKPTPETIARLKPGSWFLGMIDPFNRRDLLQAFAAAQVKAVSLEMIPRTTLAQKMDVISSQANLAGYEAIIEAAKVSRKLLPMMMTPAGTISPARVFVIGVGVAGLQAIATAKRLGARVEAFDTRPVVEEQVKSLGAKFIKIDLGEMGQTDQGYAKELTPEQLEKQRQAQGDICARSDIVVTTAKLFGRPAPKLILPDVVARMQPGSVIVDLAAETGGNVSWTDNEAELKAAGDIVLTDNGVTILRYAKFENLVPTHASQVYATNIYNFIEHFWDKEAKTLKLNLDDEILKGCLMTNDGQIIHPKFQQA
ncbi:MAG: NAD(P) transhydrogenase subunit alpha [Verrucomicrobiota bacterium JB022]|nr:NAD(P) transhydrogenase subunit alpha [Verrucomicrobiota bacterium JB022]